MGKFFKETDQELADLIRQTLNGEGSPKHPHLKFRKLHRYEFECKIRGTDISTLLENNPAS